MGTLDARPPVSYEWTAICDACEVRPTFLVNAFRNKFPNRPLPKG